MRGDTLYGCKADLKKCFDKVIPAQATEALRVLGLSHGVCAMLGGFYTAQLRYIAAEGCTTKTSITPTVSILQEGPEALLVLSALTTVWVRASQPHKVDFAVCVDDRALWSTRKTAISDLCGAVETGRTIDAVFGWQLHPDKLASFASTRYGIGKLRRYQDILGAPTTTFELLGIKYAPVGKRVISDSSRIDAKVKPRLRRIRKLRTTVHKKKMLVRELVVPAISWQGPWTRPLESKLKEWQRAIELAVAGGTAFAVGQFYGYASSGPTVTPAFSWTWLPLDTLPGSLQGVQQGSFRDPLRSHRIKIRESGRISTLLHPSVRELGAEHREPRLHRFHSLW